MFQLKFFYKLRLYIFFLSYVLLFIKFSTSFVHAEIYTITKLEVSEPYEVNFNKQKIIENAFKKGFKELIKKITISKDSPKMDTTNLKIIKRLVDSFTIVDEKFADNKYFATFDVSFNKKLVLKYLENENIFPSIPVEKKLFIMPILVDLDKKQTLLFSENVFYINWNNSIEKYHLLKYILPNEDLEDIEIIKKNFESIEDYNFKEIVLKYDLKDYIIIIFFKNDNDLKTLSKININNKHIIINELFENINLDDERALNKVILILKTIFENQWKKINQINTSIKLPLTLQVETKNYNLIKELENELLNLDLVSTFFIEKFTSKFTTYKIIYNSTPDRFIQEVTKNGIKLNTSFKIWRIQ